MFSLSHICKRWWDAENQDEIGDLLTQRGLKVKFRNPRIKDSQYPSLYIDWFEENNVVPLVVHLNEKNAILSIEDKERAIEDIK